MGGPGKYAANRVEANPPALQLWVPHVGSILRIISPPLLYYSYHSLEAKSEQELFRSNDIIVPARRKGHNSIINERNRKPRRRALGSFCLPPQPFFSP
jgi:hypothetical protein